jgi:hypothetical protein
MTGQPPDASDEPEDVDRVMLAVLSNRGRNAEALSPEQERLLDDWMANRLDPGQSARAANLVRQNILAAERVLERRLLEAAERSPAVPQDLAARVLAASRVSNASARISRWRFLRRGQWTAVIGAVALAAFLLVVGRPILQRAMQGGAPIQVAVATIPDRSPLFEPSDIRMRGAPPPPAAPGDLRFRDVDVPTNVLGLLLAAAGQPSRGAAARAIESYLPNLGADDSRPLHIFVDAALKQKLDADPGRDRLTIRIYDLADPRSGDLRSIAGPTPAGGKAYLLTLKP